MRLKLSDIDHIIDKIEKLSQLTKEGKEQAKREAKPLSLSNKERWELDEFERYEKFRELISEFEQLRFAAKDIGSVNSRIRWAKGVLSRIQVPYDAKRANVLRAKAVRVQEQYERAVKQHFSENVRPQREQLEIFLYVRKEALERLDSGIVKRIQALFDKEKGLVASEQEVSEVVFQLRKIKAKQEHSIAKKASGGLPAEKAAGARQETSLPNGKVLPPIDTEGLWESASLKKLRDIDSNAKRDGIKGDKQTLKRLKEYLTRRRKRKDIAETLCHEDRRIKTTMPHHSMFKQK